MNMLGQILGAARMLMGERPVQVRCRYIPKRSRQKRNFKAGKRRAGRHHRMPPTRFGERMGFVWEPCDPSVLMQAAAGMVREMHL